MSGVKELERLQKEGKITRREFITRLSALGLGVAISPTLLAQIATAETPKKGGRLRAGLTGGSTTDSLDPGLVVSNMNQFINMQTRNCLVEIDQNFEAIPELAASWESSPDAAQWTFKLRKGIEFHNGKTMTAEDVVYSINHHRKKDTKSAAKGIVEPIKDIKADGKHTVVFTLEGGNADFPFIISDYHLSIAPAGTEGKDWDKGIGTGGYVLKKWEAGVRVFTVRNPNYWKDGRAHFDEVETLGIADTNARTTALKTGEIDFMDRCDLKTVHLFKRTPGVEITATPSTTHYSVPMRTDMAPYDNSDVRMALKLAVDRDALVKTVLRGYGEVGNDHPIGSIQKYFAKNLPQRVYDPEKAKWHIKKAGMQGHAFKLHAAEAAFGGAVDASLLYREHAAKAGINIEVVREPNDGYWSNVWMKKEWCMCYWGGRVTPDLMFSTAYAAGAGWNDTFWNHERFNKLLVEARAELNEAKRAEIYAEMQAIVSNEGGQVIPMFAKIVAANSNKLRHGKIAGNYEMDGQRLAERWWFA